MIIKNKTITGTLALTAGVAIGWFAIPSIHNPDSKLVLRKLFEAGQIIDMEQSEISVKAVLDDVKGPEIKKLAPSVMKFAHSRPDMLVREEFLKLWGKHDPQNALAYLGSHALASDRAIVLRAWAQTDPDTAAKSIPAPENEMSDSTLADADAVLDGIAKADPVKAILFADHFSLAYLTRLEIKPSFILSHPSFEPSGSYQIEIDKWMRCNPAAAFKVIISLKSTTVREQALNELFYEWSSINPETAQVFATQIWNSSQLKSNSLVPFHSITLLETLLENQGELNGRGAYQRAIRLDDPEQRLAALKAALNGWKRWDNERLEEIAGFIVKRLKSADKTPFENEMLIQAAKWAAREITENEKHDGGIKKAVAWQESLSPSAARDAAIQGIAFTWLWSPEKQKKLEEWLITLQPSHLRNIAVATYAGRISVSDSAKSITMAATIQDSTLRAKTLAHIGAPFIHKELGGEKDFDLQQWTHKNPKIGAELQTAMSR